MDASSPPAPPGDEELLQRYVAVCNRALHGAPPTVRAILQAAQQTGRQVEVAIIDDRPRPGFVLQLAEGKISGGPHGCDDPCPCDGLWRVSRRYLQDVVDNSDAYERNPARLDWEWLVPPRRD